MSIADSIHANTETGGSASISFSEKEGEMKLILFSRIDDTEGTIRQHLESQGWEHTGNHFYTKPFAEGQGLNAAMEEGRRTLNRLDTIVSPDQRQLGS